MKLIKTLKKLGIVRGGMVGGTYKSYKDMPDELMYDNVYNKKTDLVDGNDIKKIKDTIVGTNKVGKSGSVLLFYILSILSIVVTLLFALTISKLNLGLIILILILVFFVFKLFQYKKGLVSLKYIWSLFFIYAIVSIIVLMVAVPSRALNNTSPKSTDNVTKDLVWIDYTGDKSSSFTFKYPDIYKLEDSGTSTLVFVNKSKDYDYHTTFTMLEGLIPVSKDCEGLAKAVIAGKNGYDFRYAKQSTLAGMNGCEYGINVMQDGKKIYEISYNFATKDKTFYITSYASKISDLDILNQIMQSFKLK